MSKRTVYTIITPLPPLISRETVLAALHDHSLMIELNPLVLSHKPIKPPRFAPADEYYSPWYEITDKVHYLPGGLLAGKVVYHAVCHDQPYGLQTHCYAPMGVDIKGKWQLKGTLPGEPREPLELGVKVPSEGLYIREDIEMKCNFMMNKLVKKQLQEAHRTLLDRLMVGADLLEGELRSSRPTSQKTAIIPVYKTYTVDQPTELPDADQKEPVELPAGPGFVLQGSSPTFQPPAPPTYDAYSPYVNPPSEQTSSASAAEEKPQPPGDLKSVTGSGSSRFRFNLQPALRPRNPAHSSRSTLKQGSRSDRYSSPPNISAHPYYHEESLRPQSPSSPVCLLNYDDLPQPSPGISPPKTSPGDSPALQRFRQSLQKHGTTS